MKPIKQTVETGLAYGMEHLHEFKVFVENRTASWERYGEGHATFEVRCHDSLSRLSFAIREDGAKSHRETLLDLDEKSARAFYEFLKARFEQESVL